MNHFELVEFKIPLEVWDQIEKIEDRSEKDNPVMLIKRYHITFKNGYRLSVIDIIDKMFRNASFNEGYEIAIKHGISDDFIDPFNWNDSVRPGLSDNEVVEYIIKVSEL